MPPRSIDYTSLPFMTVEEYLAFEEESDVKHECAAGHVKAMAGARRIHETVAGNLFAEIHRLLKGSPCTVVQARHEAPCRLS